MTSAQKERNKRFIKALRENKVKACETMRGAAGGRCCLAVATDVALSDPEGFKLTPETEFNPPEELAEYYGWEARNPTLEVDGVEYPASNVNDGKNGCPEKTHKEIADLFEEQILVAL